MKIVVVGDGKVGSTLVRELRAEGHDVVVIDSNTDKLKSAMETHDVLGFVGNGAALSVQKTAGVDTADLLIAATTGDELNILACLLAKKLGAKNTIARVRNPEYLEQLRLMKAELGLTMAINPELTAATEISRMIRFPSALKIEVFSKGRVELVEYRLSPESPLRDLRLSDLGAKFKQKVLVCAVVRNGEAFIPNGDFILREGDRISITAQPSEISAFFRAIDEKNMRFRVKRVMLVGGGKTAFYLSRQLLDMGMEVVIIERSRERCEELCGLLPKAVIINGDGTERELLHEEGIGSVDALVALTDIDEENIIVSMYAKSISVPKVITKVDRIAFNELIGSIGLDSVVSPRLLTANGIVRFVRSLTSAEGSAIEALYKIVDGRLEALEFHVNKSSEIIGKPLKELKLKKDILIGCIVRGGKTVIPGGGDVIAEGDSVIVVTKHVMFGSIDDLMG